MTKEQSRRAFAALHGRAALETLDRMCPGWSWDESCVEDETWPITSQATRANLAEVFNLIRIEINKRSENAADSYDIYTVVVDRQ